jgi:hypothetical protein
MICSMSAPCTAALQKYYKFNNRPKAGRIAGFFTAVGRHAALHTFTGRRPEV